MIRILGFLYQFDKILQINFQTEVTLFKGDARGIEVYQIFGKVVLPTPNRDKKGKISRQISSFKRQYTYEKSPEIILSYLNSAKTRPKSRQD